MWAGVSVETNSCPTRHPAHQARAVTAMGQLDPAYHRVAFAKASDSWCSATAGPDLTTSASASPTVLAVNGSSLVISALLLVGFHPPIERFGMKRNCSVALALTSAASAKRFARELRPNRAQMSSWPLGQQGRCVGFRGKCEPSKSEVLAMPCPMADRVGPRSNGPRSN